jgi:antitoxin CptB
MSELPDSDLYAWIAGDRPIPPEHDTAIFRRMRDFQRAGGAVA